jgi:NDP-sugar pyrophosphorylase family protein
VENSIIMEGAHIDCGRRIVDSLIGRKVRILGYEQSLPKGHRLILGDLGHSHPINQENKVRGGDQGEATETRIHTAETSTRRSLNAPKSLFIRLFHLLFGESG